MPRFTQSVHLAAPPQAVYDFVTNASLWPTWHPATRAVRDVPPRPLVLGETMVEDIRAAWRREEATWRVTEYLPPHRWGITASSPRGYATVSYELQAEAGGTLFRRTCEFATVGPLSFLDGSVVQWLLRRQAAQALENLRRRIAQPTP